MKVKSKKQRKTRAGAGRLAAVRRRAKARRGGKLAEIKTKAPRRIKKVAELVELKGKQPKTFQKTVRVPRHILETLEAEVKSVKGLTIPSAIVQILEDWHKRKLTAKDQPKSA